jgi:hypothetical protein
LNNFFHNFFFFLNNKNNLLLKKKTISLNFYIYFYNFTNIKKKHNKLINILNEPKHVLNNNFFFFFFKNATIDFFHINYYFFKIFNFSNFFYSYKIVFKKTFGEGFLYIKGLFIIFFIDACFTDDEPLWEPLEWSLVQTWIFFIFIFAWIAENLITSRYGSYTGRDKRVWFAWHKSFWLLECWYALSYGAAALFVIVPFYYELTYNISFVFSWWNWYNRIFFFKFISTYTLVLLISYFFQLNIRWLNWKKLIILVLLINFFIGYLLYSHFIISFFGYFTDPMWYQKTRYIDYIQLSHEPLKWGWGPAKRDHFTYHKVSTVFWFKNDGPFAGAFLMFHLFFFLSLFFLYFYWVVLLRRIYATKETTYTFSTYCVSSLRQFFYFFFLFYILIIISFLINYWRFPLEFLWIINSNSWLVNFIYILLDYPLFFFNFFFL